MEKNINNVQKNRRPSEKLAEEVKHLTLRLPCSPDVTADLDESAALTRLRALSELLNGQRFTIHSLLCELVETAKIKKIKLPVPKSTPIPTGHSFERLDVRLNQKQIDLVDELRDQLSLRPDILDFREYYGRPDVIRELIKLELAQVEGLFTKTFGKRKRR